MLYALWIKAQPNVYYGKIFYHLAKQCPDCPAQRLLKYYKRAVFHNPDLSHAYYEMGSLYDKDGDKKRAVDHYLKAVETNHKKSNVYEKLGKIFFDAKEFGASKKYFLTCKRYEKFNDECNYHLGRIYERDRQLPKAWESYDAISNQYPKFTEAIARMGVIVGFEGQLSWSQDILKNLRNRRENELADQLENFLNTGEMPTFMDIEQPH